MAPPVPPPPPPPHPGQAQAGRVHGGPPPMNHPQQQQRAMMQHAAVLVQQNQNQLVRTFDLEEERPIDRKRAREELSTWTVYRLEVNDDSEYEDYEYGKKKAKSWSRVKRTEVPGLEKRVVAEEVRTLEKATGSVIDKKKTLASPLQEVLEKTLQELQSIHNSPLFETNLVQLDRSDVPQKDRDSDDEDRRRRVIKVSRVHGGMFAAPKPSKRHSEKGYGKVRKGKRKNKQPASILAYYKTSPLSNVDAVNLYYQSQAKTYHMQMQPPHSDMYHQGQQGPPTNPGSFHHEGHPKPQGGGPPARVAEGQGGGIRFVEGKSGPPIRVVTGDDQPPKGPPKAQPAKPVDRPANPVKFKADERSRSRSRSQPREPPRRIEGPRPNSRQPRSPGDSSPESKHSTPFTDRDSDSSWSSTSEEDDRGRNQSHKPAPGKGRFHGVRPGHFGIGGNQLPHQQRRFSQHHIDDFAGGLARPDPRLQIVPDLDEIRAEAYAAGKADARRDTMGLVETIAQVNATALPLPRVTRGRPPTRVLNQVDLDGRMDRMRLVEDEYEDEWWPNEDDGVRERYLLPVTARRGSDYRDAALRRGSQGYDDRGQDRGFRVRRGMSIDDQHILVDGEHIVMRERGRDDGLRQIRAEHVKPRVREQSRERLSPAERHISEPDFAYGTSRVPLPRPRVGVRGPASRDDDDSSYVFLSKV